jgi:type II secretory pathway component PulF
MLSLNQSLFRQSGDQRRRLYLKLGKLLANGVPLLDALKSIKDRRGPSSQDPMGLALEDWISHLNNGRRLSQAISDWVPIDPAIFNLKYWMVPPYRDDGNHRYEKTDTGSPV